MKLYEYKNYDEYKKSQEHGNKSKEKYVWVKEDDLVCLFKHLEKVGANVNKALCHGVRNGWEVAYIRDNLCEDTIGTEISSTATKYDNVIEWDFHNIKEEWVNSIDLIYSNSFDHSYKPQECLDQWMKCISDEGRCIIHWSPFHGDKYVDQWDCFGADYNEYVKMINDKYVIEEELELTERDGVMFIVRKK
jgi:hypothetical protein